MLVFIYLGLVWFVAGFITGVTSFGGNLLAIPLITLVLDAKDSIIFGCLSGMAIFLSLVFLYRRAIPWRETIYLAVAGLAGVPAGVWVLAHAGSRLLLLLAGGCIGLFLLWQFYANRRHFSDKPVSRGFCIPFGILSGFMMSSIGMGGPPLVLYAYLRKWGKEETIAGANLAAGLIMIGMIPAQWHAGLYSPEILKYSAWFAIFAILGAVASMPFERRINIDVFRRLLLVTLAFSSLMLLIRGILA